MEEPPTQSFISRRTHSCEHVYCPAKTDSGERTEVPANLVSRIFFFAVFRNFKILYAFVPQFLAVHLTILGVWGGVVIKALRY